MSALGDVGGMIKSKVRLGLVNDKASRVLADKIAPYTIVGEQNYNTHARTIKKYIDQGDWKGANAYVDQQQKKLEGQQSADRARKIEALKSKVVSTTK